jgi:hypothetical protein
MPNNRTYPVQRSTEHDRTPTFIIRDGEMITVPAWMADVLRRVSRKEVKR